ncbi:MAG: ThuA domain-containing protein [Verrucomicrobiae bacterium]|nr:ThuA domain-containing protein [Verrucomicrobiae bacterium]
MKTSHIGFIFGAVIAFTCLAAEARPDSGPIRVLFVGHDVEHHNSNAYYPMLAQALGRDAIYFDYVTTTVAAFGDADYLDHFDAVLLYANHQEIDPTHWQNLKTFIENGGGFVPIHCASWCFQNIPEFDQVVGGRFAHHQTGVFRPKTIAPDHAAIQNVPEFEAWDETYVHERHNPEGRTVLQVREVAENDNITEPEPWTWVREQGQGRVFYTASGHDERVWNLPAFQQLLKRGILWAVGDTRRSSYEKFLSDRPPLKYEKRDNIPNYEKRPEPLPWQFPLSPEDSLKYTQAPVEFRIELFAAEPDIVNPIGLAWDERGRLWVAETVDYPNEVREAGGNDTIKILEDTDGDGRCDKVTVFADGLNIPTSLTFWNGGLIVAQAPDFLFLKDEDGDDKADVKTTLFTGWGTRDTHAGPSNLRYGFDNWIYGAVGYSAFDGELGGRQHRFGSGLYRFRPDGSAIEFLHQFNNNTWGLGFNAAGDVFGSTANNNPSFFGAVPASIYGDEGKGMSAKMIADSPNFHPITPNIRQVDAFGAYTAGAGHALATSANFPEWYRDQVAFVGGPTGDLLGRFRIEKDGSGYRARNAFSFLASADEWFSPVAAEIGPDGNLWVADWYNFIIQHNPTPNSERGGYEGVTGKGNAHENPNRDRQHGRIYRVIWEKAQPSKIDSLAGASDDELVAALGDSNLFWRQTAQRLLVENKKRGAAPSLRQTVKTGKTPAAIHALWALEGLGELDRDTHQFALLGEDTDLKRNAIRALGNDEAAIQLFFDTAVVTDRDPAVRLAAFTKLALFPENEAVKQAAEQLMKSPENRDDEWLALALKAAGAKQGAQGPAKLGPNLLKNASFEELTDAGQPTHWEVRTYRGTARHLIDEEFAHSGKRSVLIGSGNGADTSWFTKVKVTPHTDYRLSGWIKTQGINGARGAQMNVHEIQGANSARTEGLQKKNDWTEMSVEFNTADRDTISINLLFGGWGLSTGTAWWDDIALQELTYEPIGGEIDPFTAGDAKRGRKIFDEHQVAACIRCHKVEGRGEGVIGPPLDGVASRHEPDYLLESLVDPGAKLAEGFPAAVSPMPPMGVLLNPQELADVMAYLMTLK